MRRNLLLLLYWILTGGLLLFCLILFCFLLFILSFLLLLLNFLLFILSYCWALLLNLHIIFCLVIFVVNLTSIRLANDAETVFFSNINPVVLLPFFALSWTLSSPTFGFVNSIISFKDHSRFEGYFLKVFAVRSIYMRLRAFLHG